MKFDFIIGNPPYHDKAPGTSTSDLPVYHLFMNEAFNLADKIELISPARFLSNAGATPEEWNNKILSDEHFKVLDFEGDTTKVFPNVQLPGGIAITYYDHTKKIGPVGQFTPFKELNEINAKVQLKKEVSLNTLMYSQCRFNLINLYEDYPELSKKIGSAGKDKRFRQIVMERFPFLFTENKDANCIRTLQDIS